MSYWPAIKKSFNSSTYLLKKIHSQNTTKNFDCLLKMYNVEFYNEINRLYFLHMKLGLSQISTKNTNLCKIGAHLRKPYRAAKGFYNPLCSYEKFLFFF